MMITKEETEALLAAQISHQNILIEKNKEQANILLRKILASMHTAEVSRTVYGARAKNT